MGFPKRYVLINVTNSIQEHLENGYKYAGVFLDFTKAFGTIDRSILLSKLNRYEIIGLALKLIE